MKKKLAAIVLVLAAVFTNIAYADTDTITDTAILVDPVSNTYQGTENGAALIRHANYSDVPASFWAKEAITRMTALGVLKGDGAGAPYRPSANVTKEEAISLILRMVGKEQLALEYAQDVQGEIDDGTASTTHLWSLGYLQVAMELGMITPEQYADAAYPDQSELDPAISFMRRYPATREEVAAWLSIALNDYNGAEYLLPTDYTYVKNFTDWGQIHIDRIQHVESLLQHNIMSGVSDTKFSPQGTISRAQIAQVLKNVDQVYFDSSGYERKTGTVAACEDEGSLTTSVSQVVRKIYIRSADGTPDIIELVYDTNTMGTSSKDAVVNGDGVVSGLYSLAIGDEIEYIVDKSATGARGKQIYYVNKTGGYKENTFQAKLLAVDPQKSQITFEDSSGRTLNFTLAEGMIRTENKVDKLVIDGLHPQEIAKLPYGSNYEVTTANNIVKFLKFLGQEVLENEIGGVVVENNPALGYIKIFASNGQVLTKQYYESEMTVKKLEYYDAEDEIGYISQMFPNFRYNPAESSIDAIEPGDIVFLRLDKADPNIVTAISASTNYVARYGKVIQFDNTSAVPAVLVEAENKQTIWYDIVPEAIVTKEGRISSVAQVMPGDWVRILVNQAIMAPGYYIESVKEVTIEGDAHYITSIAKGELGAIDAVQQKVTINNYQTLTKTGWSNHKDIERLDISGRDTEIYMDGKRISLDYALKYLKRGGAQAYIALENNYGGERIKKITFRTGRDDVLSPDVVVNTAGDGKFLLSNSYNDISSDEGTIVVRYGRLVTPMSVMPPDYANVVVNGGDHAAVVSIDDAPGATAPLVFRGRIQAVDEGKNITLSTTSMLTEKGWIYTPVQRVFTLDANTKYFGPDGIRDINTLLGYGTAEDGNVIDEVFTIYADGSRADWLFAMPYTRYMLRGTVVSTGESIRIKDVLVFNPDTGTWSQKSNAVTVDLTLPAAGNGAVIKSNQVVGTSAIAVGDRIRIATDENVVTSLNNTGNNTVQGYMVFVEQ